MSKQKKQAKQAKPRTFTFLSAPSIPDSECKLLEKIYKQALKDKKSHVITNYDVSVVALTVYPDDVLVVTAPNIPTPEVKKLRTRIERKQRHVVLAVNHPLNATTVPLASHDRLGRTQIESDLLDDRSGRCFDGWCSRSR